ncbi:putative fungal-specific transcription factor [Aspergillus fumigatus]|uniref:Fungal specific transcription factor, putative n=1 Tax=Aspergillus fumigatus (strain CBS 144.89 / FGSC A1163 / CEA10) TaxID=451804 RepID=B0XVY2_ASPFC|nr:fungal specific transcription factor, putative [Aspergillus fumigatus A1163]
MELKWVADTPQSRSRKRALRACSGCQRKKVSSYSSTNLPLPLPCALALYQAQALLGDELEHTAHHSNSNQHPDGPSSPLRGAGPTKSAILTSVSHDNSRAERFVGDLNPEAVIREKLDGASGSRFRDRIGLWISSQSSDGHGHDTACDVNTARQSRHSQSVASLLQERYSSALNACHRLPSSTRDQLIAIFFSRIHPILPLIDKDSFLRAYYHGSASVFLERAICLVAAKDQAASSFLRTSINGPLSTPRQFGSEIYTGLVVAMDAGLESDRITRIRTLALMSLHCEGHEGAEAASMHLCRAIHEAQTAGLHLNRPDRVQGDSLSRLFWCLWTLDKMHASIGGRPVLLADRDIGLRKPIVNTSHPKTTFDVWFAISDLLSSVISFYRPSADPTVGWETSFPSFEELMGDNFGEELDFTMLSFLEVYYQAVAILSCRSRMHDRSQDSNSSIRQGLAAVRIHSIVATECAQDLPPLPIIPYALSLSMSVSYQQFRSSRLITHFNRAKASLEACCSLLESMSIYWYSAEAMARLGRRALHEINVAKPSLQRSQGQGVRRLMDPGSVPSASNAVTHASTTQLATDNHSPGVSGRAPAPVAPQGDPVELPADLQRVQENRQGALEDIDVLFGDFLDLSLPTNFWDPVFLTEENGST